MGKTADIEALSFVDVGSSKRGDFMHDPKKLDAFLESPLGKAQSDRLAKEILAQGVTPVDMTTTIRRALIQEQIAQDSGTRKPDLTEKDIFPWYKQMANSMETWVNEAKRGVENLVSTGASAAQTGVTQNTGLTGKASEAIGGRQIQIERAVDEAVNGSPARPLKM